MNDKSCCRVDCKSAMKAMVAVFVAVTAAGFFFNHVCVGSLYEAYASSWRPQDQVGRLMPLLFAGYAVFSWFFVSVYARGYEAAKPPLGQGLRFALLIWPLASLWGHLGAAPFLPIRLRFFAIWALDGLLACLAAGLVVGLLYRPKE